MNTEDFACHCGCGFDKVDNRVVSILTALENLLGNINVSSVCRCKKHNEEIGGAKNSAHLKGLAADVVPKNDLERYRIVSYLLCGAGVSMKRLGIYKTGSIHFDFGDVDTGHPTPRIWIG